jgi:hypothetical protein
MHGDNREVWGRQCNALAYSYEPVPALSRLTLRQPYLLTVQARSRGGIAWHFLARTDKGRVRITMLAFGKGKTISDLMQGISRSIYAPDALSLDKTERDL